MNWLSLAKWTPQEMIISERTNLICLVALHRQSFIYFLNRTRNRFLIFFFFLKFRFKDWLPGIGTCMSLKSVAGRVDAFMLRNVQRGKVGKLQRGIWALVTHSANCPHISRVRHILYFGTTEVRFLFCGCRWTLKCDTSGSRGCHLEQCWFILGKLSQGKPIIF